MSNRRFGTANKFGTTNKFGASTAASIGRPFTFALEVDWDNDGVFDGYNELSRLLNFNETRGREFIIDSVGAGFQPVETGRIDFELKNTDRRYDPFYMAGDLYGLLSQNQKVRFRTLDESTGTLHDDFVGYIDDIKQQCDNGLDKVIITVFDGIKKLKDKNISSSAVSETVQYDDQIAAALTAAGWTDTTDVDTTASDSMTYHWFRGNSAFWEISQLVEAVFGLFFVASDGAATYKSYISVDDSVVTLTEADIDYYYGIKSPSPRATIRNKITIFARARKLQTAVELWRMTDIPQIGAGTTSPIWASYSIDGEEVPATAVTEPAATTDFTANDQADGLGTNRTANFSFARTGFATTSKLIPTNAGAAAYLTLLKLRGNAITADKYTFTQDSDAASISAYGERELVIKSDWLQDLNTAVDRASFLLGRFKEPRFFPRVQIKRGEIGTMYAFDLFDIVTLNFTTKDIAAEMRVGYIQRSWSMSESSVINTIIHLEPNLTVSAAGAWVFPITFPATFA